MPKPGVVKGKAISALRPIRKRLNRFRQAPVMRGLVCGHDPFRFAVVVAAGFKISSSSI
jgi:predicted TIM-barrel enzyme